MCSGSAFVVIVGVSCSCFGHRKNLLLNLAYLESRLVRQQPDLIFSLSCPIQRLPGGRGLSSLALQPPPSEPPGVRVINADSWATLEPGELKS